MKPRTCPHCSAVFGVSDGFHFDGQMNLVCGSCRKIAFPATSQAEWTGYPGADRPVTGNGSFGPNPPWRHQRQLGDYGFYDDMDVD